MKSLIYLPFVLQGLIMVVDEFHYHKKRGLPLWERIGHPLDTLSVLACYSFLLFAIPSDQSLGWYFGLCLFSCLFITKDEFVHAKLCAPGEIWLHSLLFVLHPITLFLAGYVWIHQTDFLFIQIQTAILAIFLLYQSLYWSFYGRNQ
jgi:hypothetical protein